MTSLYMPAVSVEVAFNAGYVTPDADRVWTDVSQWVELDRGVGNVFGRQDELATADANRLTLTLDNTDGRFTAGRAASPYHPNVKIGRPVRLRLNWLKAGSAGTFEDNATGWSGANASVARSSSQARTGAASLSVTAASAANMTSASPAGTDGMAVRPSMEYAGEVWVRAATSARTCDLRIDWYTAAGASISTSTGASASDSSSAWTRLTVTATSPSNAAYARLRVLVTSPANGEVHYVDDARLAPSAGSTRFVGFVDQWPVEWDGTDAYAQVTLTGGSRLSRLGLGQRMRSAVETAISTPTPSGYWTLGDPSGSIAAADSSGTAAAPLEAVGSGASVTFGNGVGSRYDDLSAAEIAGTADRFYLLPVDTSTFTGQYLAGTRTTPVLSARITARVTSLPTGSGSEEGYAYLLNFAVNLAVTVDETGNACIRTSPTGAAAATAASIGDGETHDVALVLTPGVQYQLYVDGASSGPPVATAHTEFPGSSIEVGQGFAGTACHVAVYDVELTAGQVALHAEAVLTGFEGDATNERLERLLGWAGVSPSEIDAAAGDETMTYQQTGGMSVVDALREVESTEGGVLFDGRDGRVTFHNRSHRYIAPVAATFDMAAQQVEADYAPRLDRSTLANDVTVDNPTTGETARSVDATSADEYGTVTASAKSVADSYEPLQQKAAWLVASYAEPRSRVPSLTVDVLAQVGSTPSAETILALTVGSRIRVTNQPAQADATEADYFVEGYTEAIGPESYRITFNLSPAHPSLSTFVLEDATRGQLDSSYVLAL